MVLLLVQIDDQGIVNTDSRTIAVPHDYANFIPTDIRGLTFARTPQQVLAAHSHVGTAIVLCCLPLQPLSAGSTG